MRKNKKQKKYLLFGGLIMIALSAAVGALLFSLQFEELWRWYAQTQKNLYELEVYIMQLDQSWKFLIAITILFMVKSFFPIYATSTVCFLSGMFLPAYIAIPVNVFGFTVLITVRYFWGRRFGAGGAWKFISKNDKMKKLIQQEGGANSALLIALRLLPGMPINSISGIYGSMKFGYVEFVALSVIGFMPKLISFTLVGRNVYDPLSASFLLPIAIFMFATGLSLLCVNGVWTTVEKAVEFTKNHNKRKETEND